jgi:hypothetical protein
MRLTIDTAVDSPEHMRLYAQFLLQIANSYEAPKAEYSGSRIGDTSCFGDPLDLNALSTYSAATRDDTDCGPGFEDGPVSDGFAPGFEQRCSRSENEEIRHVTAESVGSRLHELEDEELVASLAADDAVTLTEDEAPAADEQGKLEDRGQLSAFYRATVVDVPESVAREEVRIAPSPAVELLDASVDSAGETWDPRFHSETRAKTADGKWRRRRNTGKPAAARAPTVPPPPPIPAVPTAPTSLPAVPTQPAVTVTGVTTFPELVKYATQLMGTKRLNHAQLLEACTENGVKDIHACSMKPEVIPAVAESLAKRVVA